MSNISDFQTAMAGSEAASLGGRATVAQAFDFTLRLDKLAADAMANTATADTLLWSNPFDFAVRIEDSFLVCTGAGITGDNTDFVTITLKSNDGAGGATSIAKTLTTALTDAGTISQNQPKAFTVTTAAGQNVPASGGGIWLNIAKSGAGKVVPISYFMIRIRRGEFRAV